MESVLRVLAMYAFLLLVFRLSGRRTLSETTTTEFLLLLVISETTQQAMVNDDHSMTNAFLMIVTFLTVNVGLSLMKLRWQPLERVLEGTPLVIVQNGRPLRDRMVWARVDEEDILEAARLTQGVGQMSRIRYAVLERSGEISVVPAESEGAGSGGEEGGGR